MYETIIAIVIETFSSLKSWAEMKRFWANTGYDWCHVQSTSQNSNFDRFGYDPEKVVKC